MTVERRGGGNECRLCVVECHSTKERHLVKTEFFLKECLSCHVT